MIYKGFIGGSYQSQATTADQEWTVNWYVEKMQSQGASTDAALYPTPGVTELTSVSTGPGRAHWYMSEREFAVIGTTLWEIDKDCAMTNRGTVALDGNPASISSNGEGGDQLFITSGSNGYVYDLTANTLTQITALNGKATFGDHIDGYFVALDALTSTFYISALLDGTSWTTGTDWAQRSIAPDPWVSMKVLGRFVWLFGEVTSEIWYNTGATFPFGVHASGLIPFGIAAPWSVAVADQYIQWVATTETGGVRVMYADGFKPETVSDHATQRLISAYSRYDDAVGDSYHDRGHVFYLINFPTAQKTLAWDAETKVWAERGTWDSTSMELTAQRVRWYVYAFDEHRALDSVTGSVYRVTADSSTDVDGRVIRRIRRAPGLNAENERIYYSSLEVDLEPGLGLEGTAQGSNPLVMMRMSNDGGKTWSSERMMSAGKIGEYNKRVKFERLGCARRRVFEISVTDPIPWRLTNAYLTLSQYPGQEQGGRKQEAQQ